MNQDELVKSTGPTPRFTESITGSSSAQINNGDNDGERCDDGIEVSF
jgi:hypothetical protein